MKRFPTSSLPKEKLKEQAIFNEKGEQVTAESLKETKVFREAITAERKDAVLDNAEIRRQVVDKLKSREIDFLTFLKIATDTSFKTLRTIKVKNLIIECYPGWNEMGLQRAFQSCGIKDGITIGNVLRRENLIIQLNSIVQSSASKWQRRFRAPSGWPWHGNVLDALKDIDPDKLPYEIGVAVRHRFDEDPRFMTIAERPKTLSEMVTPVVDVVEEDTVDTSDALDLLHEEDDTPSGAPLPGSQDSDILEVLMGDDEDDDFGDDFEDEENTITEDEVDEVSESEMLGEEKPEKPMKVNLNDFFA